MNSLDLQALRRACIAAQPGGKNNENTSFIPEVMMFVSAGDSAVSQAATVAACAHLFGATLLKDLAFYRFNDRYSAEWWQHRSSLVILVMPQSDTYAMFKADAKAKDILGQLDMAALSS
jgi:hypothetical protein